MAEKKYEMKVKKNLRLDEDNDELHMIVEIDGDLKRLLQPFAVKTKKCEKWKYGERYLIKNVLRNSQNFQEDFLLLYDKRLIDDGFMDIVVSSEDYCEYVESFSRFKDLIETMNEIIAKDEFKFKVVCKDRK